MPDITAPLVDFATSQVGAYGAIAILLLMVLESACIPVPSEAIMLYGGFLVARGQTSLLAIVVAGVAGNLIGSALAYGAGRWLGRDWVLRARWLHVTPERLALAERWFARRGDRAVLLSRCLPIVRTFISLPAGVARMPFARFSILTAIGCIPWVAALAIAGQALGSNWESLQHGLHYVDYAVAAAIVGGAAWWLWRRRAGRRASASARSAPSRTLGHAER
jgi:membrane protein DedA with SNARE-associated domain